MMISQFGSRNSSCNNRNQIGSSRTSVILNHPTSASSTTARSLKIHARRSYPVANTDRSFSRDFDPERDIFRDATATTGPDSSHVLQRNSSVLSDLNIYDLPQRIASSSSTKSSPVLPSHPSDFDKENENPADDHTTIDYYVDGENFFVIDEEIATEEDCEEDRSAEMGEDITGDLESGLGGLQRNSFYSNDEASFRTSGSHLRVPKTRYAASVPDYNFVRSTAEDAKRSASLEEVTEAMREMQHLIVSQQQQLNAMASANQHMQGQLTTVTNMLYAMGERSGGFAAIVTPPQDSQSIFPVNARVDMLSKERRSQSENAMYNVEVYQDLKKKRKPLGELGGDMHDNGRNTRGRYSSILDMSGSDYARNFGPGGKIHDSARDRSVSRVSDKSNSFSPSILQGSFDLDDDYSATNFDSSPSASRYIKMARYPSCPRMKIDYEQIHGYGNFEG